MQEAYLRAWNGFARFRGADDRVWILTIVRNACYTWLRNHSRLDPTAEFDQGEHTQQSSAPDPRMLVAQANRGTLERTLQELPTELRESIALRELEGLSYKQIGEIAGVPVVTVMSRLARARARLRDSIAAETGGGELTCVAQKRKP